MGSVRYRPESGLSPEIEVTIATVGARGDGIAVSTRAGNKPGKIGDRIFVPLTAPGDRVRVRLGPAQTEGRRGQVIAWLERGPDVVEPPCRHFGRCGGCSLQHLGDPAYGAWKSEQVTAALARGGFEAVQPVPLARTPPGGRRRVTFTARRRGTVITVGFNERLSHRLVDLEQCPVLASDLEALIPRVRQGLVEVLPDGGLIDVIATRFEDGIDLVLVGPPSLDLGARQALAELAETANLARLSWQPDLKQPIEPVAARRPVLVRFGDRLVAVPPGAFLQASLEGESALVAAVLGGVGDAAAGGAVADLFAGCGTFSLPLASTGRRVHAVDGNGAALAALAGAARGLPGVTTEQRDLGRNPLSSQELAAYQAVVFDPPRAGASAQVEALAGSGVPVVVAVSCNPATFARDAHRLNEGGYRLVSALAVDQFLWSAHIELVAVFRLSRK